MNNSHTENNETQNFCLFEDTELINRENTILRFLDCYGYTQDDILGILGFWDLPEQELLNQAFSSLKESGKIWEAKDGSIRICCPHCRKRI